MGIPNPFSGLDDKLDEKLKEHGDNMVAAMNAGAKEAARELGEEFMSKKKIVYKLTMEMSFEDKDLSG